MEGVVGSLLRQLAVGVPVQFAQRLRQLPVQITPFAQPQPVEEFLATSLHLPLVTALFAQIDEEFPDVEQREEIALGVLEPLMRAVGGIARLEGPLTRVRHRERCGNYQHFGQHPELLRFDQHATDARIDRDARQLTADVGQLRCVGFTGQSAQLLQLCDAVSDRSARRRLDERELLHAA